MKRLLSVFLAFAMVLSLGVSAAADTSHDVTANYTPFITGLTVTGNSSTTSDGALVFAESDMMTVTVNGRNLDIATVENAVFWGNTFSLDLKTWASEYWTISEDGSTATYSFQYSAMSSYFPANYQMYYTNESGKMIATGIFIHDDAGTTPDITKMEIISGAVYDEATGIYTVAYGSTDDVVIKISGSSVNAADKNTIIRLPSGDEALSVENGWSFTTDGLSATKAFSPTIFYGCTSPFTVKYSTDGTTFADGLKVQYETVTVSVDITWGKMSFNYAANAWTAEGNTVTVATNDENVARHVDVSADFAFSEGAADLGIGHSWDKNASTLVAEAPSCTFTLSLSGKPTKAFDGTLGTVTLTIAQGTGLN